MNDTLSAQTQMVGAQRYFRGNRIGQCAWCPNPALYRLGYRWYKIGDLACNKCRLWMRESVPGVAVHPLKVY